MSFSNNFFRGTQAQAREYIKKTSQTQGWCVVNFLYFAQAMKFRVYEENSTSNKNTDNSILHQYNKAIHNSDILCIDGIAMQIFDRVGQFFFGGKRQWTENLNGTDFLPYILQQTKHQKIGIIMNTVYDPKINKGPEWMEKGLQKLQNLYPHIDILLSHQTLFQERGKDFPIKECQSIINNNKERYDHILFLNGIGGPTQEIWTHKHKDIFKNTNIIILNNGATLDYYSGFETRAPQRIIKIRIGETLRRVITQPQKNLKKFLAMFQITTYWIYIIKKVLNKINFTGK